MSVVVRRTLACLALTFGATLAVGCSTGSTDAYCTEAAALVGDNPAAAFAAWNPADPTTTSELSTAAVQLHDLAAAAPPEIEDDAGLIASTADELAELLSSLGGDELDAALRDRKDEFAEVDEASRRVTAYTRTQCGVDLEAQAPAPTTTVPTGDPTTTELP